MDITSPVNTSTPVAASSTPININSGPSSAPLPPKASTSLPDQAISLDFDGEDSTSFDVNKLLPKPEATTENETENTTETTEEQDPFDLPKDVSEAIKSTKPKDTTTTPEPKAEATTQQGRDYNNLPTKRIV